jgi:hypothetical protein
MLLDAFMLSFPLWAVLLIMLQAIIVHDAIDNCND